MIIFLLGKCIEHNGQHWKHENPMFAMRMSWLVTRWGKILMIFNKNHAPARAPSCHVATLHNKILSNITTLLYSSSFVFKTERKLETNWRMYVYVVDSLLFSCSYFVTSNDKISFYWLCSTFNYYICISYRHSINQIIVFK